MGALLRCGLLVTLFTLASTANPGAKLRVTQNGLHYANEKVREFLAHELRNLRIDNQSGKNGRITWELKNIQNRGVSTPLSRLSFDPAHNAIAWSLAGLSISLRSEYSVRYRWGWVRLSNRGKVDASFNGAGGAIAVRLAMGRDGRPVVSTAYCRAEIASVSLRFHGSWLSWLINLFRRPLENRVRGILQTQICRIVERVVNQDGNRILAKLKVSAPLDRNLVLDYSLASAPVVTSSYLDIPDKGEVYWRTDRRRPPFTPNTIPALSDTSRMLYLWVTEYPAKTALLAAQNHDYFKLDIGKNDLRGTTRDFLDTTCNRTCVGAVIPQIGRKFRNRRVKMVVSSNSVPDFTISPNGISLTVKSSIDMFAEASGQRPVFLLTLNMTLSLSVRAKIVNERILGEITGHSFELGFVKSVVGSFNPRVFNTIISAITSLVVVPYVNRITQRGVDLPVTGDVTFRNTRLQLRRGSLLIATDVNYNYVPTRGRREIEFDEEAKRLMNFEEEAKRLDTFEKEAKRQANFQKEAKRHEFEEEAKRLSEFDEEAKRQDEFEEEAKRLSDFDEEAKRQDEFEEEAKRLSEFDEEAKRQAEVAEEAKRQDNVEKEAKDKMNLKKGPKNKTKLKKKPKNKTNSKKRPKNKKNLRKRPKNKTNLVKKPKRVGEFEENEN